jgi:hypothetical protein
LPASPPGAHAHNPLDRKKSKLSVVVRASHNLMQFRGIHVIQPGSLPPNPSGGMEPFREAETTSSDIHCLVSPSSF